MMYKLYSQLIKTSYNFNVTIRLYIVDSKLLRSYIDDMEDVGESVYSTDVEAMEVLNDVATEYKDCFGLLFGNRAIVVINPSGICTIRSSS